MAAPDRSAHVPPLQWRFGQCFGDKDESEEFAEADILSAVEFDSTGNYLATGDKGGRIVLFQRADLTKAELQERMSRASGGQHRGDSTNGDESKHAESEDGPSGQHSGAGVEYKFYTEFQSHEAEFDYLKSLEIEEKINKIAWCPPSGQSLMLLSTNDKTVKLWRVYERDVKVVGSYSRRPVNSTAPTLRLPQLVRAESAVCATPRRIFANAHAYHINSVSPSSDGEMFLSADDLRINLWHMDRSDTAFNVMDIKPESLNELAEVITTAMFHPTDCSLMTYGTSCGDIHLVDTRERAICDSTGSVLHGTDKPSFKGYYDDIVSSVSDMKFMSDGRRIVSRCYNQVKIWDMAMGSSPVQCLPVHPFLNSRLNELYDTEFIFDKFGLCISGNSEYIMTGSYGNIVYVMDHNGETETAIGLSKTRPRPAITRPLRESNPPPISIEEMDLTQKVMHYSWHPELNVAAVAGLNNLYIYTA